VGSEVFLQGRSCLPKISLGTYLQKYKMDSYNKSQRDALFLKFILVKNSTCFRHICCPTSGVSRSVYTVLRLLMMDSRSVRNM
jgi:hypothetical protein